VDEGQLLYITIRLVLGAVAAFFAIMLWAKTRDMAWMFIVIGIIAAYVETVYSILEIFGITGQAALTIGSVSLLSILLSNLPAVFFLIALAIAVARKYRKSS
jgi:hypothetical protein